MAERPTSAWVTPRVVFPFLALLALLVIITAPDQSYDDSPQLTSYGPQPQGAKGIYETLDRLGWRVERRLAPFRAPLDSAATYVLLWPPEPVSGREVGELLDAVRRGAGLIVAPPPGSAIRDSLGLGISTRRALEARGPRSSSDGMATTGRQRTDTMPETDEYDVSEYLQHGLPHEALEGETAQRLDWVRRVVTSRTPLPPDTTVFLRVETEVGEHPAVLGVAYGRGRIVVIAEPDLARNVVVRRGASAVLLVRAVEYAAPDPGGTVVFGEWHHGHGERVGLGDAVRLALFQTPVGRVALQLLLAAGVLLLALAPRPIAPRAREVIERRSPLEHVGALAQAYAQVGATRLATQRLTRGLRRRHPTIVHASSPDDGFLGAIRARHPSLEPELALLSTALTRRLPGPDFPNVAKALHTIERTLTR